MYKKVKEEQEHKGDNVSNEDIAAKMVEDYQERICCGKGKKTDENDLYKEEKTTKYDSLPLIEKKQEDGNTKTDETSCSSCNIF